MLSFCLPCFSDVKAVETLDFIRYFFFLLKKKPSKRPRHVAKKISIGFFNFVANFVSISFDHPVQCRTG